jgi:hypothetical protein
MKSYLFIGARGYFLLLVLAFLGAGGCGGYRFASDYNNLPEEVESISIPFFKNETFESNIEAAFTNALINEFIKNKQFEIIPNGADATLVGVVREFRLASIAYMYDRDDPARQDRARQYRVFITLELTLTNNDTGAVIWRNPRLVHDEEYDVTPDIAFTDANKDDAIQRIALELAEQIYEEVVLGF